jgi:hypothetical protein
MRALRVNRICITVLLLIVTFSSLLHAAPVKNLNGENAGAATGSESSAGNAPTDLQMDRDTTALARPGTLSPAAGVSPFSFGHLIQVRVSGFAATNEVHHSDLPQRQHALRI